MSKKPNWKLRPESAMMSHGYDAFLSEGAVICPEFHSTTYAFKSAKDAEKKFCQQTKESTLVYGRVNNPNAQILEERLALWENAESCVSFSSGMAAIFAVCFEFLKHGDMLLYSEPIYGGSHNLFSHILPESMDITALGFNNLNFESQLKRAIVEYHKIPKMIFIETPANPTNGLIDMSMCKKITRILNPLIVVDNTFLGPIYQHPLEHGADISVYSATKFISGHSDVIAGACAGSNEYMDRLRKIRMYLGSILGPDSASRLLRSLQTLELRMDKQVKNSEFITNYLNQHPKVRKVYSLSLLTSDDLGFDIYKKQCLAPGAVISFDIKGGKNEAFRFLDSLSLFKLAVSLGSNESLAQHPFTMTHAGLPTQDKEKFGITESMIRLSIGIEHKEDLMQDLDQALASA